jgi:lantibiotic modifying enzyme
MQHGVGWKSAIAGGKPLAGFSHGAAGIAWALLQLAALTHEQDYRTAALDALEYERSLFSQEFQNWPDLRELETPGTSSENNTPRFIVAWCHGAPGVGLGRLASLSYFDDASMRAEIHAAVNTTLARGFGLNHSLCHGDFGNVELLLKLSEVLPEPSWDEHLRQTTNSIVDSINRNGWICGVPSRVESPGLMTGLAGMGYELLRLAEPDRVPSVLLLEPIKGSRPTGRGSSPFTPSAQSRPVGHRS